MENFNSEDFLELLIKGSNNKDNQNNSLRVNGRGSGEGEGFRCMIRLPATDLKIDVCISIVLRLVDISVL